MHSIKYSPDSITDLDLIFSFVSQDNKESAYKMLDKIESSIHNIAEFPRLGAVIDNSDFIFVRYTYRFYKVDSYIIYYRLEGDCIIIVRILHSKRDWLRTLLNSFDM